MTNIKNTIVRLWDSLGESWRFAIAAFLIARLLYAAWSWVLLTVQPVAVQNFVMSGEPVLSVFNLTNSQAYVYHRNVNGDTLTFETTGPGYGIDQQTGSVWDLYNGEAIDGPYKSSVLAPAETSKAVIFPYHGVAPYPGLWLAMWQRFDANWYTSLAERGYGSIPGDDHFPPLFPLLIRVLLPVFGSAFLAGLFISHAATLLALKLLYDTFSEWGEATVGKRAFLFFVIYPTFFFFFSAYSEPLFLAVVLLSLQAMRARSWAWAGFWTFCAILTRLQGAALLAPMALLLWQDRPLLRKIEQWVGVAVAGMGGLFYLYLRSLQVSSGALPMVESVWHARLVAPWETYLYSVRTLLSGHFTFIDFLNWAVVTLFLLLLVWCWRRIPLEYNLYTAFSLLIMLIRIVETQPLISMSRYSLTLFPVFYSLGLAGENPILRRVILYTFLPLQLYLSGQFFLWGWVA